MDAVEVVARIDDTILDVRYVTGTSTVAGDIVVECTGYGYAIRHGEGSSVELPAGHRIGVRLGLVELVFARVARPARTLPTVTHLDRSVFRYLGLSLVLHLMLWVVASDTPQPVTIGIRPFMASTADGIVARTDHPSSLGDNDIGGVEEGPPRTSLALLGTEQRQQPEPAHHEDTPRITKEEAIESARKAGWLEALRDQHQGFDAVTGTADLSVVYDDSEIYGSLFDNRGEGGSEFGYGRSHTGPGGGCDGCGGTVGTGRYGTIGSGRQAGDDWGHAGGTSTPRVHATRVPTVIVCGYRARCGVSGELDKSLIRRVLRRHRAQLTYCYEKQLLATPELAGVVDTEFLIAPDGHVQSASAAGVAEPVARCVKDVIESLEFPHSNGNTLVHYPLTYRPAGQ